MKTVKHRKESRAGLETCIREFLERRRAGASICPSEVARKLYPETWRQEMECIRETAREMARAGTLEITQKGELVDPDRFRGPIRLRLPRGG